MKDPNQHILETALAVQAQCNAMDVEDKEARLEKAVELGELGAFSNRAISKIVGVSSVTIDKHRAKSDRSGGRFDPDSLSLIYDLWSEYANGGQPTRLTATVLGLNSALLVSRLTGVPTTTLKRWAAIGREEQNAS